MKKLALLLLLLFFLCACEGGSETFTVTLDFDYLGMIEKQQVENGCLVSKPLQNPTLPDRNNLGWFVQESDGQWREWNFETDTISSDITLKLLREEQVVERYTYALIYDDDAERVDWTNIVTVGIGIGAMSVYDKPQGIRPAMWVDAAYVDALLENKVS